MIDSKDLKTIDAFSTPRRGRPSTGVALSAAERMRAKRLRDAEILNQANLNSDYSEVGTTALLEGFADAVTNRYESIAKKLAKELVKRSKLD